MSGKRLFLLTAVCLLVASAAWADDIGFVDCARHPEGSPVYAKARQSQETVGSVSCGERFAVLLYGFIFSRIQTSDNRVGYVFSSVISVDHSMASLPGTAPASATTVASSASSTPAPAQQPMAATSPQAQPAVSSAAAPSAPAPTPSVTSAPAPAASTSAQPAATAPEPAPAEITLRSSASAPAATSTTPQPAATASASAPAVLSQPQSMAVPPASAASQPAPAEAAPAAPAPTPEPAPRATETAAPAPPPEPPPVRSASVRSSWERPIPAGRKVSLIELYGGYAFTRFNSGTASVSNLNGGMGAFAVNIKPWLQMVGDSSYDFITSGNTKTILYGNHFGPRFYYRGRHSWGISPFAEALVGGSRLDTTVSGTGGYKTSDNCLSYKFGGGLDVHPSRHFEIRLLDVDYYRTSFGTNTHQNSYWASAGIILRLIGGRPD